MKQSTQFNGIAGSKAASNRTTSASQSSMDDNPWEEPELDEDPPKTNEQVFAEQFLYGISPEEVDAEEYPWKEQGDMITIYF
jgi:hypothetical protein